MVRFSITAVLTAATLLASATTASAQAEKQPDYAKAKVYYEAAETAAAGNRWEDAARDYGIAYEITKDAVLFYKIGNAYHQHGDCVQGLVYYKRYLAEAKPARDFIDLTNKQVETCEAKVAAGEGSPPEQTETTTGTAGTTENGGTPATQPTDLSVQEDPFVGADDEPPVSEDPLVDPASEGQPSWQRTAAWISVGVAVAFGVTGSVLGLAASAREDDIGADIDFRDGSTELPARYQGVAAERYDDLVNQGEKLELAAFISLGAAGAAVAAAAIFFAIDPGSSPASSDGVSLRPSLRPSLTPESVGLSAGWSFE